MEPERRSNRGLWIVLAVIVALLGLCCLLALLILGFFAISDREISLDPGEWAANATDRVEHTFQAGAAPTIEIDNIAGTITLRAGAPGAINVVTTRRAPTRAGMDDIQIEMEERDGGLKITTSLPRARAGNRAVNLELEVPADASVIVDNGAGEVVIDGLLGNINVHTGAGEVRVTGDIAGGSLHTGAGTVRYDGLPLADLELETGAGTITILLPRTADLTLDLDTGAGSVSVGDFNVVGSVSPREVQGTLGRGGPTLRAHTGAGSINLRASE